MNQTITSVIMNQFEAERVINKGKIHNNQKTLSFHFGAKQMIRQIHAQSVCVQNVYHALDNRNYFIAFISALKKNVDLDLLNFYLIINF